VWASPRDPGAAKFLLMNGAACAELMWACDFIQIHDLLFRQRYAFFKRPFACGHILC